MDVQELMMRLMEGLIVLAIILFIVVAYGPQNLQAEGNRNWTKEYSISMINKTKPPDNLGPLTISVTPAGGSYFYHIVIDPPLRLVSHEPGSIEVIPIITFNGRSVRASVDGAQSTFTITTDSTIQPTLIADISSDIPPIVRFDNSYNGNLGEGSRILIKNDASSVVAYPSSIDTYYMSRDPNNPGLQLPRCMVIFSFESSCPLVQTNLMGQCTPDYPNSCRQSVDVCNGQASVIIRSADCSQKTVNIEDMAYTGGKEWVPGEKVLVSFWLDGSCTRGATDNNMLKERCADYYLGAYELNGGIIP